MPNRNRNAIATVLTILRFTRGRLGLAGTIAVCGVAALFVLFVQPMLEGPTGQPTPEVSSTPVELPPATPKSTRAEPAPSAEPDQSDPTGGDPTKIDPATIDPTKVDPRDLGQVLTDLGRGAYRSPGGLRYTRGSFHGHRVAHLMSHAIDDPDRDGPHGVFDETDPAALIRLIDRAYAQAQSGEQTDTRRERERTVYEVDLGRRIGYVGGESGARRGHPAAQRVRLVIEGDRLITAFPINP